MSDLQVAYAVILAVLTYPAWGRQSYVLACLWGNLLAIFAICLAMDLDAMGRDMATVSMLIVDLATGAALSTRPGIPRLIAWGYAVTVPIYSANLVWAVPINATFGIIYIAAFAQLGVLAVGAFGGFGGGGRGRRGFIRPSLDLSGGNMVVPCEPISCYSGQDRMQG